jgi:hypothetical protein
VTLPPKSRQRWTASWCRAHQRAASYGVAVSTLAAGDDNPIATAFAADLRQAEYFRSELQHQCDQLDDRMTTHEDALSTYQRRGELNQVRRMQNEIRLDERERDTLQRLLAALDKRFPRSGCYPIARASDPATELIGPGGRSLVSASSPRRLGLR